MFKFKKKKKKKRTRGMCELVTLRRGLTQAGALIFL